MPTNAIDHAASSDFRNGNGVSETKTVLRSMIAESESLELETGRNTSDILANWLVVQYVSASNRIAQKAGDAGIDLPTLSTLATDVVALRRGDHNAARLRLESERLEIERNRSEQHMNACFEEWLKQPGIAERLCGTDLSLEERERRMREIFGLPNTGKKGLSQSALSEIENAARLI